VDVAVKNVKIFNRLDCCRERLSGANVILIDNSGNYREEYQIGDATGITDLNIPFGPLTRKVRIDLGRAENLHMREVQVFDYNNVNRALNKPATQSSEFSLPSEYPASNVVDGNLNTISHTSNNIGKCHHISAC
jgi:hypothetical protein